MVSRISADNFFLSSDAFTVSLMYFTNEVVKPRRAVMLAATLKGSVMMERARLEVTAAGELHSLLKDKGENMSSLNGERRHWLLTEFPKDLRIALLWMVPS